VLEVLPIPAFDDNYIWLLRKPGGSACAVVDPGDADPVIERLERDGGSLAAILITHKHGDHTGGIRELKARWPQAVVYGPAGEPIPTLERRLSEGDLVDLPELGARFRVMDVPGHTEGHIAYLGDGRLFCGDTLFAGGCGRVFSGTHEQLSASLEKIAALPAETLLYCAHEYTLANLGFAQWVEPDSASLARRIEVDRASREQDHPTVPSTLELELQTNPFLRTDRPEVIAAAERWQGEPLASRAAVFRAVRTWKDRDYD
jgi:hydroxyacylglutathione hydrolase